MPIPRSDEQHELVATTHRLLHAHEAGQLPPSWSGTGDRLNRELWRSLVELGLVGVGVPEAQGGSGGGLRELCLVVEQIGASCARVPFTGAAVVLGANVAHRASVVDGSVVAVPAWETFPIVPRRRPNALQLSGSRVDGQLTAVPFGMDADVALAFVGDTAVTIEMAQPEVAREPVSSFDVTEPVAAVSFSGATATIVEPGPILSRASTVLAAELVGTGQRALDGAVDYAKQRRQFGRAIGSFQAIKHMLADSYVQLDAARLLVDAAITADEESRAEDALAAARTALVAAITAAETAAGDGLQTHGGIGFTWEHPSHVYLKRVRSRRSLLGSPAAQLDELATHVLASRA
jgi:acyl-CoA dehydrogenase